MKNKLILTLFSTALSTILVTSIGIAPPINAQNDCSGDNAGSATPTGNSTTGENKTTSSGMGAAIPTP